MAYNIPAVYEILPIRIRAYGTRPWLANCGGVRRVSETTGPAERTQSHRRAAMQLQSCYVQYGHTQYFLQIF